MVNGKKVWITGKSEQEVAEAFADLLASSEAIAGYNNTITKTNFKEYVFNNWCHVEANLAFSTKRGYSLCRDNSIIPFFGDMNLEDITWREVQQFVNQYKAYQTANQRVAVLSKVFKIAQMDGILTKNPASKRLLSLPQKKSQRPPVPIGKLQEIRESIPYLDEFREKAYLGIISYTGVRKSEALGLMWSDIDWKAGEHGAIRIQRAAVAINGRISVSKTKSTAGNRTIPMSKELRAILLTSARTSGYIVHSEEGFNIPCNGNEFQSMWRRISKQVKMRGYTSHCFRHTFGTELAAMNIDPKTIQTLIGHANISMTFDTYVAPANSNMVYAVNLYSEKVSG